MDQSIDERISRAVALHLAGRLDEAEDLYREALSADPLTFAALKGLGALLLQTVRYDEAHSKLSDAVKQRPDDLDVLNNLGAACLQCGKLDQAVQCYEGVLRHAPANAPAHTSLGLIHFKRGDLEASARAFAAALAIQPDNIEVHINASRTYRALRRFEESLASAETAVKLGQSNSDAWINLGRTLEALGDYDAAETSYRSALRIDPNSPTAHHNLAQVLLQLGRLQDGWAEFEWRWRTPDFQPARPFQDVPQWNGEPLKAGTLLVWAEQGIGDEILYSTMFPELEAVAPHVVVSCAPRLVSLFRRAFPFASVADQTTLLREGSTLAKVTAQIAAGSLGQFLRPSMERFQEAVSPLQADQDAVQALRGKYDAQFQGSRRIGVSWRSANPKSGRAKSLSVSVLASCLYPVLNRHDGALFDLQYGASDADRAALKQATGGAFLNDPDIDPLTDLDRFAAQIAAMDLVITVSNTTAHMAGALGVPCWVLLPLGEGLRWYWFLDRSDSPWYPSLRLFRQTTPGDWTAVVKQVNEALKDTLRS